MITELLLNKRNEVYSQYDINNSNSNKFEGLKKINVFVGANNTGKSRFLRELFKSFQSINDNNIDFPFIDLETANKEFDKILDSYIEIVKSEKGNITEEKKHIEKFKTLIKDNIYNGKLSYNEYTRIIQEFDFRKGGIDSGKLKAHNTNRDIFVNTRNKKLKDISHSFYIPVLRSLKKITNEGTPLKSRTLYDYFESLTFSKLNVFTGEDLYKIIKNAKSSPEDERGKIKEFEKFLGNTFFKSVIELVPLEFLGKNDKEENIKNENEDIYIKIGKEPEFSISKIGDGIQALIILTFQLFLHSNKNLLLFIEEPELNLHPGLQRLFLETLNDDRFKNTQIFFTTHSNHFLDLAIEISPEMAIFSFEKKPVLKNKEKPKFKITDITKRSFDALNLLGVNSSSVFLSNCTIWVEGISDRLYIRKYLEIYQKENPDKEDKEDFSKFLEDIHYSFIEYAGDNIKHWSFLDIEDDESINYKSISRNVFLISDKDKGKEKRHKKLVKTLGNKYYCLKCLEIENLLTPEILKATLEEYAKVPNKNLKFEVFKQEDYFDMDMGEFIYSSIISNKSQFKQIALVPNRGKTRKIINKYNFAKNAIENIKDWRDLSKEAQDLTKAVYQFIKENNKS
jgi:AAA15 family ATPase/GTPase